MAINGICVQIQLVDPTGGPLLGAAIAVPLEAQYTVGRLEGTIFDATGAVVSGAAVTLQNLGTGATRTYITGADGLYVFFAMPAGDYELTAEALHFAKKRARIQILTSETTSRNMTLGVGPQSATVEVLSETPGQLNITDAQLSTTRTDLELSSLPSSGRNMISLIHLAPGVQPMNNPRGGSTFGGGGSLVLVLGPQAGLFSANGGRARSGSVQLDYTDANDWEYGGFALGMQSITPEMLQEFKLLTSNFSAEYGVKSNAEVIMVSKSGTNHLHGSAYDFVQNTLFNARDYLDTSGQATPVQSNVYGVSAGGPVLRNRTFLFGAYERRNIRGNALTTVANLPTQSVRDAADADPKADPIALALMNQYLPLPKIASAPGRRAVRNENSFTHRCLPIPAQSRPAAEYPAIAVGALLAECRLVRGAQRGANQLPGFDTDINFALNNANLTDSYVVGMRTVNQLRLSYGYARALSLPQNGVTTPRFQIGGAVPLSFGSLQSNPAERRFNIYQVNDTLSHSRGGHILSVGFDVRKIHDNSRADTNTRGIFTFPSPYWIHRRSTQQLDPIVWQHTTRPAHGSVQLFLPGRLEGAADADREPWCPLGGAGSTQRGEGSSVGSRSCAAGDDRQMPAPARWGAFAWAVQRSTAILSTSLPVWGSRGTRIAGTWCSAAVTASIGTRSRSICSRWRARRLLSITSQPSPAFQETLARFPELTVSTVLRTAPQRSSQLLKPNLAALEP